MKASIFNKGGKLLIRLKKFFSKKSDERSNFTTLAPTVFKGDDLKDNEIYLKTLRDAIQIPENENIALMGNYGAGKSSILRTFEEKNPEYRYLFLSLASFFEKEDEEVMTDKKVKNLQNNNKIETWERIEQILVKQIIYRETSKKIPYSRFKRISHIPRFVLLLYTSFIFILINLISQQNIIVLFLNNLFTTDAIVYGVIIVLSMYFIYIILFHLTRTLKLSKFSFRSITVETSDDETSYFSKYLEEIIYFFEVSKTEIVVIEDIDRFNSITIFEHLRELNYLLNNSNQIKQRVRFIYAVRDDLFNYEGESNLKESEEYLRTKFFDFIIPVIPVVDYNNSRDFLVPKVKAIIEDNFSDNNETDILVRYGTSDIDLNYEIRRFLWSISLYIDDLRLIYNICNEFEVYLKKLSHINSTEKLIKLFSMIVYKNIYPEDFSALQRNYGKLFDVFNSIKQGIIEKRKEEIKGDLKENKELLVESSNEIRHLIKSAIIQICMEHFENSNMNVIQYSKGNNNVFSYKNLFPLTDSNINDFLQVKEFIGLRYGNNTTNQVKVSKDKVSMYLQMVGVHSKKLLQELENEESEKIKNTIHQLEKEKLFVSAMTIAEVFEKGYSEKYDIFEKFLNYKLLIRYLLSEGHIDEQYNYYISNLYDDTLSMNDVAIIQKLKANTSLNENEKIINYELALFELTENDYMKTSILNEHIIIYIFDKLKYHKEQKNIVKVFVYKASEFSKIKLLRKLFTEDHDKTKSFISMTLKENPKIFSELAKNEEFDSEIKKTFVKRVFGSCEIDLLQTILNSDGGFESFILTIPNFVPNLYKEYNVKEEKLNEFFSDNIIKFENTGFHLMDETDFLYFLKNDLYRINKKNVLDIHKRVTSKSQEQFSISELLGTDIEELTQNITDHFDEFVHVLKDKELFYEDSKVLIRILNESEVSNDFKEEIIKNNQYTIEDVTDLEDLSLRRSVFQHEKYNVNLRNIMQANEEEFGYISPYFENKSMVRTFIIESSHLLEPKDSFKEELRTFLIRLVNEYGQEVNATNIELFEFVKEYTTANISDLTFETLLNAERIKPTTNNINKLEGKNKIKLMSIDEHQVSEDFQNIELNDQEIVMGLSKFRHELLDKVIGRSFENGELIVTNKVEWLKRILSSRIMLSVAQINKLFTYEEILKDDTILQYLIFIIPKSIVPESNLLKNIHSIDDSLKKIQRGSRSTNRVHIKYYDLLKALEDEQIISSVKIKDNEAVFFNKRN